MGRQVSITVDPSSDKSVREQLDTAANRVMNIGTMCGGRITARSSGAAVSRLGRI